MDKIDIIEKRTHRRLDVRLPLDVSRAGVLRAKVTATGTRNVSTGGLYFEAGIDDLNVGDELMFELGVPAGDTRFPTHAKITTIGRVVRVREIDGKSSLSSMTLRRFGIGAKFQKPLKLTI